MLTSCIAVIVFLGTAEGLTYNGEPYTLIDIPMGDRTESMCRNESLEEATEDLKSGDQMYCPGMTEFLDLMMAPTDETAIENFISKLMDESVYGDVLEKFTLDNEFSEPRGLLKTIWFKDNFNGSSLFKKVFVKNKVKDVVRINSFGSYLYHSAGAFPDFYYQPEGHWGCNNETEVPVAACFNNDPPVAIVYLPDVNPLFDVTVFTLAAMMGKLIVKETTQRNLTFLIRHPDDEDCMVPLTVLYKTFSNSPPISLTYHNIQSIYYNFHAEDGITNMNVCYGELPGINWDENEENIDDYGEYDADKSDTESQETKKKIAQHDMDREERLKKFNAKVAKKKALEQIKPRKKRV